MTAWLLIVVGLVLVGVGTFVGIISWEVTMATIVVGALLALMGVFQLFRGRRTV